MRQLVILITGAGAPGIRGTLYALRRNEHNVPVRIVAVDTRSEAVGRWIADAFHVVPPPEDGSYIARIDEICHSEGVQLIIPQTTREIAVLSRYREALSVPVMVAGATAVDQSNNKETVLRTFMQLGMPYPRYFLVDSLETLQSCARELGYPRHRVVVKPPLSNGMRGFRVLDPASWNVERFLSEKPSGEAITLHDLERILTQGQFPPLLVTEYLPGPEYSVDSFIGQRAQVAVPRLRRAIRSGITFESVLEYRRDLVDYTLRFGQALSLSYCFGVQYKLDADGVPKVLECNPRVQGTMVASVFSGINVIWMGVLEALGEPPSLPDRPPISAEFVRYWGGLNICGGNIEHI